MDKYLIMRLNKLFPDGWILAGSTALREYGLLDRPTADIDVIVNKDYYHDNGLSRELTEVRLSTIKLTGITNSGIFRSITGRPISSFSVFDKELNSKIDIFYHHGNVVRYKTYNCDGYQYMMQDLDEILTYKLQRIELFTLEGFDKIQYKKHLNDIKQLVNSSDKIKDLVDKLSKNYRFIKTW